MSLRERQQMNLDSESATHTGMEGNSSRCSHKHLLLQVWCGLLTVAIVVMATFLSTIRPKSIGDEVFTLKTDQVGTTGKPIVSSLTSAGSPPSYIQLIKSAKDKPWEGSHRQTCHNCSLVLHEESVYCKKDGLYFIYAQVTFSKHTTENHTKSVILKRNPTTGRAMKKLVEGTFPHTREGSVWVANIVRLQEEDSVSIEITGDFLTDNTFWGVFQLH